MKVGVLFSGGKDSTYATYLAKKQGYKVVCLITILSKNKDSYMFQYVNKKKIEKIAYLMNLPIVFQKTKGIKEEELKDLEKAIRYAKKIYKIKGIFTGAIASSYQKERIEKICSKLNLKCFNPLWGIETENYLEQLIKNKFKVKIVKVAAEGLDEKWIGKTINKKNLEKLKNLSKKFRFNLAGEGGEFETEIVSCPLFFKKKKKEKEEN